MRTTPTMNSSVNLISGIPPTRRGTPQIAATFDIDADGIVIVSANDKATGKEQHIQIRASGGLFDAEIDRMVKGAAAQAVEDKKRKEAVEAKNSGEALLYSAEKTVSEHGSKLGEGDRRAIENAMSDPREALKGEGSTPRSACRNSRHSSSARRFIRHRKTWLAPIMALAPAVVVATLWMLRLRRWTKNITASDGKNTRFIYTSLDLCCAHGGRDLDLQGEKYI